MIGAGPGRRQALVMLVSAVLAGAAIVRFHDSWALPAFVVLAATLPVLAWIDVERLVLPNRIVYPMTGAVVVLFVVAAIIDHAPSQLGRALLGGVVAWGTLLVLHLLSPGGMGFGDVKLAFSLGAALGWLGWDYLVLGFFLAFVLGALVGFALVARGRRSRRDHLPFGPFLAAGTLTGVLFGGAVLGS